MGGGLSSLGLWWGIRLGLQGHSNIVQPEHGATMQAEHMLNALHHRAQQHAVPVWACKDAEAVHSSHLPQVHGGTQQADLSNSWAVPPSFWKYLSCRGLATA